MNALDMTMKSNRPRGTPTRRHPDPAGVLLPVFSTKLRRNYCILLLIYYSVYSVSAFCPNCLLTMNYKAYKYRANCPMRKPQSS